VKLIALDVALLPPPEVAARAVELSAALAAEGHDHLRLDADHLPHITLMQLFVREEELDAVLERVDGVVASRPLLPLRVSGGGRGSSSVWMAIERTPAIDALHEELMEALRGYERPGGTKAAFHDGDARPGDVLWVTGYRLKSAFGAFTPHITLGHAPEAPDIAPFDFVASTVAGCHLGRFCSCRRVFRRWELR
jgi:2'-5' RNA ligase